MAEHTRLFANVERQSHGMGGPLKFYDDISLRCRRCLVVFDFSAKEQQYWYEERNFIIDSWPKECPECRRFYRRLKGAHKFLAEMTASQEMPVSSVLKEASIVYAHLGRVDKARAMLRRACKGLKVGECKNLEHLVERACMAPELIERSVPDIPQDPFLRAHLFVVVADTCKKGLLTLPMSPCAALERLHHTTVGNPGRLSSFKNRLIEIPIEARHRLQANVGAEITYIWNNSSILDAALMLLYQMIGGLHHHTPPLEPGDHSLIEALRKVFDHFNRLSSEKEFNKLYPVERTKWGGYLLPF